MSASTPLSESSSNFEQQNPIILVSYNESNQGRRNDDLFPNRERRVLILYVGGTIGMTRTTSGALKPRKGYLTQVVKNMGELRQRSDVASFDIVEYDQLLDSSDMNGEDYLRIANDIAKEYDNYDGFLVLHGTDTMHYTASALSFLLMNLAKPVLLTGSMVPLVEPYSDARRNFLISLMLASNPTIREVCVFFNDSLLRGNCCCKLHHSFGAFCSPNYPALGVVEANGFHLREYFLLSQPGGPLKVQSNMSGRVMTFFMHADCDIKTMTKLLNHDNKNNNNNQLPMEKVNSITNKINSSPPVMESNSTNKTENNNNNNNNNTRVNGQLFDAIVLEINGVGSLNSEYSLALRELAQVAQIKDIVMCVVVREPFGSLSRAEVQRLHFISPYLIYLYMTAAAAEVKLMYLFGKGFTPALVREMMPRNFRGEITPGSSFEANL